MFSGHPLYRCEGSRLVGIPRRFSFRPSFPGHTPRQPGLSGNAQVQAVGLEISNLHPRPLTPPHRPPHRPASEMSVSLACPRHRRAPRCYFWIFIFSPSIITRLSRAFRFSGYPAATKGRRSREISRG